MSDSSEPISNERKDSNYPEMDYFDNEELCDVVFVIEGQRLWALKSLLLVRNKVFRAMFSKNFKESKDKEVVIEDTTFEAFKTMIQFLYTEQLVLKDPNDFKLIDEIHKLSDRYEAYRLSNKLAEYMKTIRLSLQNIELVSRIADTSHNKELIEDIMTFIDKNFKHFTKNESKQLVEINDFTHKL